MFKVIAGENKAGYRGTSEVVAYKTYDAFCFESRYDMSSDIYGCDVFLYRNELCIRQLTGHIQEAYNLPHTD
jgi:hypothetical protein